MSSPFYGCVLNGAALAAVSVLGLVNPTLTEEIIRAVINSTPLQPFPADLKQGWAVVAMFSNLYLGVVYILLGLQGSREFAEFSVKSRLFLVPVLMAIVIQAFGMSTGILLFVAVDAPLALYTQSELQARPADGDVGGDGGADKGSKNGRSRGKLKMILVVNTDLGMSKGKIGAQCAHAAVGVLLEHPGALADPDVAAWRRSGQAKVVLKASQAEMVQAATLARRAGIRTHTVTDAGRTQIAAGSRTVCAIGPVGVAVLDSITGRGGLLPLKLL